MTAHSQFHGADYVAESPQSDKPLDTNFVERVTNWIDEGEAINEGLSICGPDLIANLTRTITLRELARRSGLSPTYLSQVANAKVTISPGAYVKLACLEVQ